MKLSKPMLKVFLHIASGGNTIEILAKEQNKSSNWITEVVQELQREGFVIKKRSYKVKGSRISIEVANTIHAIKLKELIYEYPGISFDDILADSRLLFLTSISEDWTNIETVTKLSGISKYIIDKYRPKLKNRGIIVKNKNLYTINEKAWPLLKEFLIAYKNYASIDGQVKWKYNEEILFEVNNENSIQGKATGLYSYKDYGVSVGVISALCILPKKDISKEEVFIHSLFEVKDPRTLNLALTFYLKNKLSYNKVLPIAIKYGKYTMFNSFARLLDSKEEKAKFNGLPEFDRKDFIRVARLYGVKNV